MCNRGVAMWVRHGRGCMDQVFAVRQVCEKYMYSKWERCIWGFFGFGKGL